MNKLLWTALIFIFTASLSAQDIVGFWKSVEGGKAQCIVGIYEYEGKCYGRIITTFNTDGTFGDTIYAAKEKAPGVKGDPFYAGLDFIWNLQKNGSKYTDGSIMDPEQGKIYDAELWIANGDLIVRGEIWVIGRNQTWPPAVDSDFPPNFKKPDLKTMIPKIPEIKEVS